MASEAVLREAVLTAPGDDTPRLVYADLLDDTAGDAPDPAAQRTRAAFIRTQVALANLPPMPDDDKADEPRPPTATELLWSRRCDELAEQYRQAEAPRRAA